MVHNSLLSLPLHETHPTVTHLAVPLSNGEQVYYTEQDLRTPVENWPGVKAGDALGRIDTVPLDKRCGATMEEAVLCHSPAKVREMFAALADSPTRSSYGISTKKLCQKIFFTGLKEFIRDMGKTFLLNLLLSQLHKDRNIAMAVASSGIAATLHSGGRTAHSQKQQLQQCKLMVWDECTISHKRAVEALNRSLQYIRGYRALMGSVVVLLADYIRQTLPVIERGTPADEINTCLKASPLWATVEKLHLITNMRVHLYNDLASGAYASVVQEWRWTGWLTTSTGQTLSYSGCRPTNSSVTLTPRDRAMVPLTTLRITELGRNIVKAKILTSAAKDKPY
ncbi:hypothetical protein PR048_005039 [Dryococelus australis]|uniref:ATP-dependent DNA helicase n=1 Tax=Dryococelus australis TaxID=614101 RepID=A0ABQ9I735_9NEOP|nr:hypothetical protein PR048_005039 [Dryococelus australis]